MSKGTKITDVRFTMSIKSSNAVIVDAHRGEIADTLEQTARKIRECYTDGALLDTNGNGVGRWSLNAR